MRIKNLHLENFRGFEKLDIEFPEDSNVTVFIGENGSGKSSILDAIVDNLIIFLERANFLVGKEIFPKDRFIPQNFNNTVDESQKCKTATIIISNNFAYNITKEYKKQSSIRQSTFGYDEDFLQNETSPKLICYYSNNNPNDNLLSFNEDFEGTPSECGRWGKLNEKKEIINDIYRNALNINLLDFKNTIKVFENWFLEKESIELQTIFDEKNFNFRLEELEIFRNIIKVFYNNLNDVKFDNLKGNREKGAKIFDNTTQWIELTKDNETLRLNQISSGELVLLMLVTDMARRLLLINENANVEKIQQSEGIVLIDEIELHLHPKWQRNIVPALTKTFPNIQFIITTHSPQVLSYVPNGSAFSIENGKAHPVNTYGRDNEWILETIMDDIARPKEIQEQLDKLFDLIRTNEILKAKELRKEIASTIGEDEAELLKADILIQRKSRTVLDEAH